METNVHLNRDESAPAQQRRQETTTPCRDMPQSSSGTAEFREYDVFWGRNKFAFAQYGNQVFRRLVRHYREAYQRTNKRYEKAAVIRIIIHYIQSRGGRFLRARDDPKLASQNSVWDSVTKSTLYVKVGHALRSAKPCQHSTEKEEDWGEKDQTTSFPSLSKIDRDGKKKDFLESDSPDHTEKNVVDKKQAFISPKVLSVRERRIRLQQRQQELKHKHRQLLEQQRVVHREQQILYERQLQQMQEQGEQKHLFLAPPSGTTTIAPTVRQEPFPLPAQALQEERLLEQGKHLQEREQGRLDSTVPEPPTSSTVHHDSLVLQVAGASVPAPDPSTVAAVSSSHPVSRGTVDLTNLTAVQPPPSAAAAYSFPSRVSAVTAAPPLTTVAATQPQMISGMSTAISSTIQQAMAAVANNGGLSYGNAAPTIIILAAPPVAMQQQAAPVVMNLPPIQASTTQNLQSSVSRNVAFLE